MKAKTILPDSARVPIVGDGAISVAEFGEGRLIPVLIIDCSAKPDLAELIRAHEHVPVGDITISWGRRAGLKQLLRRTTVLLFLNFKRPSELSAVLEFNLEEQGGLVDWILQAHAVYLQPSESGTRVSEGLFKPKVLLEIPDTGFGDEWGELYGAALVRTFRKSGLSRREAIVAKDEHIARLRELSSRRRMR